MLSRGSSAKWRSPNALIPSLKDSSAPAERSASNVPGRLRDQPPGDGERVDPAPLSFAPGTTRRIPMSAIAAADTDPEQDPEFRQRPAPRDGAEGGEDRAADDRRHQRRAGVHRVDQAESVGEPWQGRVEDEAGVAAS